MTDCEHVALSTAFSNMLHGSRFAGDTPDIPPGKITRARMCFVGMCTGHDEALHPSISAVTFDFATDVQMYGYYSRFLHNHG